MKSVYLAITLLAPLIFSQTAQADHELHTEVQEECRGYFSKTLWLQFKIRDSAWVIDLEYESSREKHSVKFSIYIYRHQKNVWW